MTSNHQPVWRRATASDNGLVGFIGVLLLEAAQALLAACHGAPLSGGTFPVALTHIYLSLAQGVAQAVVVEHALALFPCRETGFDGLLGPQLGYLRYEEAHLGGIVGPVFE